MQPKTKFPVQEKGREKEGRKIAKELDEYLPGKSMEEKLQFAYNSGKLDIIDAVCDQIFSFEILANYTECLINEALNSGEKLNMNVIDLSNVNGVICTCLNNLKKLWTE